MSTLMYVPSEGGKGRGNDANLQLVTNWSRDTLSEGVVGNGESDDGVLEDGPTLHRGTISTNWIYPGSPGSGSLGVP